MGGWLVSGAQVLKCLVFFFLGGGGELPAIGGFDEQFDSL